MGINVLKRNGDKVLFDSAKLKKALAFSGASKIDQERIAKLVEERIYEGITTRKIYQIAHSLIKQHSSRVAGRYRLRKAIMELGPTGFPFEKFVGKLYESAGYQVETGLIVQGKCVQHEVDVVARKPGKMIMIECKFHNDQSRNNDVKIPLYIQSRFLDIKAAWEETYGKDGIEYIGGLVTNTRFSDDALTFGECVGLSMISWDYPHDKALKYWIDKSGLHPLTSLTMLKKQEKQLLLEEGIVLCRELKLHPEMLTKIGVSSKKLEKILIEAENLISQ